MILGIGVDLLHLPRLASLVARRGSGGLAKRILSKNEHEMFTRKFPTSECRDQVVQEQQLMFLAKRWCIKEAIYKALFPVQKLEWKQVTVTKLKGKPVVEVDNAKAYGIKGVHVSLSHDGDYVIAQILLEG
ncbi:4'-phosphopantetheinyl transferase [Phycomyces blakesleeanus]|uniref:4'-phosphopantetheinyl transferase n=1 Tax=Phycomyces blakesleeanus TaxID=4837 RepID=A0ABR3AXQ3_PHYBL